MPVPIKPWPLVWNPKKGKDMPTKAKSTEVDYDKNALNSLIRKANIIGQRHDPPFKVVGPVPASLKSQFSVNYETPLSKKIYIPVSKEYMEKDGNVRSLQGSSLKTWLEAISKKPAQYHAPEYDANLKTLSGKTINPYHKDTYLKITREGIEVDAIVEEKDVRSLINGVIIIHATRYLGQAFLLGLTSNFGDLVLSHIDKNASDHEGVVIRNEKYSKYPFKITGEFIVRGMYGEISKKMASISESKLRYIIKQSIIKIF